MHDVFDGSNVAGGVDVLDKDADIGMGGGGAGVVTEATGVVHGKLQVPYVRLA